jgi:hypothetical protein
MKALGPYEFIDGGTIGGTHQNNKYISVTNQRTKVLMWVRVGHHFIHKYQKLTIADAALALASICRGSSMEACGTTLLVWLIGNSILEPPLEVPQRSAS